MNLRKIAVTGTFGYSGKYITRRLLNAGHEVLTLTNSVRRENPFGERVRAFPFNFDRPALLRASLAGVDALINTYWVRFNHSKFTHEEAVSNTKTLFECAKQAGIRRIVHVSITSPELGSDLPYFRGKAELELALQNLAVSNCILRPAVLFGKEDILINNIAWGLRHLPVFGLFGRGDYKLQPIYVDDLAAAAVAQVRQSVNSVVNAIGPETFTYRQLVEMIKKTLGLRRLVISVPPSVGYWSCRLLGLLMRDVVLTKEEIRGLMQNRLFVTAPALGGTKLTEWVAQHREHLGRRYTSELARRRDRATAYRGN